MSIPTVCGRPASFQAGGEFPLPANDESKAAVEFHTFGTKLEVKAMALGNNQVRLEVGTKVSEVDNRHALEINGVRVPGLSVRQCDTAVELSFGQTAVMTGLLQRRTEAHQDDSGQMQEVLVDVGLMVIVTPEIISPIEIPVASADREMNRSNTK